MDRLVFHFLAPAAADAQDGIRASATISTRISGYEVEFDVVAVADGLQDAAVGRFRRR
jgi:hypothetical protein